MKKIFLVLTILIIGFSNTKATCPTGWTEVNFTYEYISDCEITVYYCHITLPTGEIKVKIDRITIDMPCGLDFINTSAFWDDLANKVRENYLLVVTFPPCPLAVFNVEIRRAECWAVKNVPANPITQTLWYMELIDCGMIGFCEWYYKICYDSNLGINVLNNLGYNSISSELCPDEMPDLPPNGKTWFDEWTTECYGVTCVE